MDRFLLCVVGVILLLSLSYSGKFLWYFHSFLRRKCQLSMYNHMYIWKVYFIKTYLWSNVLLSFDHYICIEFSAVLIFGAAPSNASNDLNMHVLYSTVSLSSFYFKDATSSTNPSAATSSTTTGAPKGNGGTAVTGNMMIVAIAMTLGNLIMKN